MWIMIVLSLKIKIMSIWAQSDESRIKFINLVWMIADQNFYAICFTFFILRLRLLLTTEGQSLSGPKVKIVPTVQHWNCHYFNFFPNWDNIVHVQVRIAHSSHFKSIECCDENSFTNSSGNPKYRSSNLIWS